MVVLLVEPSGHAYPAEQGPVLPAPVSPSELPNRPGGHGNPVATVMPVPQ